MLNNQFLACLYYLAWTHSVSSLIPLTASLMCAQRYIFMLERIGKFVSVSHVAFELMEYETTKPNIRYEQWKLSSAYRDYKRKELSKKLTQPASSITYADVLLAGECTLQDFAFTPTPHGYELNFYYQASRLAINCLSRPLPDEEKLLHETLFVKSDDQYPYFLARLLYHIRGNDAPCAFDPLEATVVTREIVPRATLRQQKTFFAAVGVRPDPCLPNTDIRMPSFTTSGLYITTLVGTLAVANLVGYLWPKQRGR